MKKNYIYLVATLLLAGCAQDAFEESNLQETDVPQEIKLSSGTSGIEVAGRGVGSVGSTANDASNNVWNGHKLSIFSINKGAKDLSVDGSEQVYLRGKVATANKAADNSNVSPIVFEEGSQFYPLQGAYNFFGYYIDGAQEGNLASTKESITQKITIDGSQDIMIAKADLSVEQKKALVESMITNLKLTGTVEQYLNQEGTIITNDKDNKEAIDKEFKKAFSSYTARRDVQPNLVFNHQLTRLNFHVIAGDDNAMTDASEENVTIGGETYPKGILISSIELINARTKGIITITANDITFAHNTADDSQNNNKYSGKLTLKAQNTPTNGLSDLVDLTPIAPNSKTDYKKIGESILAFPEDTYTININTIQYVKKEADGSYKLVNGTTGTTTPYSNVTLSNPAIDADNIATTFEAGKSYDIKIKVYSNQEISISATLTGWIDGGDVEVSPGDEMFD